MQHALFYAPVATYVQIPPSQFLMNYKEGIYTDSDCSGGGELHGGNNNNDPRSGSGFGIEQKITYQLNICTKK
jgi:hypothetical protein